MRGESEVLSTDFFHHFHSVSRTDEKRLKMFNKFKRLEEKVSAKMRGESEIDF
jgi:hypothetical protein